eukprot:TRINITY_DN4392_c0_g1_i1.p1 TRINITY_DN4392_c0_g1~~TRINITY_DN4392_c0_g1_i1.p1  ORF type:complete len:1470 (-),score=370.16 TRINITY_DN4392_c0_g1_i1:40-4449(-)
MEESEKVALQIISLDGKIHEVACKLDYSVKDVRQKVQFALGVTGEWKLLNDSGEEIKDLPSETDNGRTLGSLLKVSNSTQTLYVINNSFFEDHTDLDVPILRLQLPPGGADYRKDPSSETLQKAFKYFQECLLKILLCFNEKVGQAKNLIQQQKYQFQILEIMQIHFQRELRLASDQMQNWKEYYIKRRLQNLKVLEDSKTCIEKFQDIPLPKWLQKSHIKTVAQAIDREALDQAIAVCLRNEESDLPRMRASLEEMVNDISTQGAKYLTAFDKIDKNLEDEEKKLKDLEKLFQTANEKRKIWELARERGRRGIEPSELQGLLDVQNHELNMLMTTHDSQMESILTQIVQSSRKTYQYTKAQAKQMHDFLSSSLPPFYVSFHQWTKAIKEQQTRVKCYLAGYLRFPSTIERCIEEIKRRQQWAMDVQRNADKLQNQFNVVVASEMKKREIFIRDFPHTRWIPLPLFPGFTTPLPNPAVFLSVEELDEYLPKAPLEELPGRDQDGTPKRRRGSSKRGTHSGILPGTTSHVSYSSTPSSLPTTPGVLSGNMSLNLYSSSLGSTNPSPNVSRQALFSGNSSLSPSGIRVFGSGEEPQRSLDRETHGFLEKDKELREREEDLKKERQRLDREYSERGEELSKRMKELEEREQHLNEREANLKKGGEIREGLETRERERMEARIRSLEVEFRNVQQELQNTQEELLIERRASSKLKAEAQFASSRISSLTNSLENTKREMATQLSQKDEQIKIEEGRTRALQESLQIFHGSVLQGSNSFASKDTEKEEQVRREEREKRDREVAEIRQELITEKEERRRLQETHTVLLEKMKIMEEERKMEEENKKREKEEADEWVLTESIKEKKEIEEAQEKEKEARMEVREARQDLEKALKREREKEERISKCLEQIRGLEGSLKELEETLTKEREASSKLSSSKEYLEGKINMLTETLENQKEREAEKDRRLEGTQCVIQDLQDKLAKKDTQQETKNELQRGLVQLAEMQEALQKRQEQCESLESEKQRLEKEKSTLTILLEERESEKNKTRVELAQEVNSLREQMKRLEAKSEEDLESAREKIREQEVMLESLQRDLTKTMAEIQEMEAHREVLLSESGMVQEELRQTKIEQEHLRLMLVEARAEVASEREKLRAEIEALERETFESSQIQQNELVDKKKELEELNIKYHSLTEEISSVNAEKTRLKRDLLDKTKHLEMEKEQTGAKLRELQEEKRVWTEKEASLLKEKQSLEAQLCAYALKVAESQEENRAWVEKEASLLKEKQSLEAQLSALKVAESFEKKLEEERSMLQEEKNMLEAREKELESSRVNFISNHVEVDRQVADFKDIKDCLKKFDTALKSASVPTFVPTEFGKMFEDLYSFINNNFVWIGSCQPEMALPPYMVLAYPDIVHNNQYRIATSDPKELVFVDKSETLPPLSIKMTKSEIILVRLIMLTQKTAAVHNPYNLIASKPYCEALIG